MKVIERDLKKNLQVLATYFPVVSLTGPRQSGKSTLVQDAFPSYSYITFDDLTTRRMASEDPIGFMHNIKFPVIIDEAQIIPELFNLIKLYVDKHDKVGSVILSGSQNFLLSKKIGESLAGRVGIAKLLPYSYMEMSKVDDNKSVDAFILDGAYPRKYTQNIPSDLFYSSYIETYIQRDVDDYLDVRNLNDFKKLISLLAQNCGQLINYSRLSNDLKISIQTVKKWISILESSYIIYTVPSYSKNVRRQIIKAPKLYFYDTGLLCNLLNIKNVTNLIQHDKFGLIFENFVFTERIKASFNNLNRCHLCYYRDTSRHEIDLIEDTDPFSIIATEIKSGMTFQDKFNKVLRKSEELLNQKDINKNIIYRGAQSFNFRGSQVYNVKDWLIKIYKNDR